MTTPGRLRFDGAGRLRGPAVGKLTWNDPWPTPNGEWGSRGMRGMLEHTMVGSFAGTIAVFNNPDPNQPGGRRSAWFCVAQVGDIHQMGPVGKGWVAWHAMAANFDWYGTEFEDEGNPDTPISDLAMWAGAQIIEALSGFAGFPLAEANTPAERGFGTHAMGGADWGGHTCPDEPPQHVRSQQRPEILRRATLIRAGTTPPAAAHGVLVELPGGSAVAVTSPPPPGATKTWG